MKKENLVGKGFVQCGRPHFLVEKIRVFLNLWCVRKDKGEGVNFSRFRAVVLSVTCVRTDKGVGVNFSRFRADVFFMDGPYTTEMGTEPNPESKYKFRIRI